MSLALSGTIAAALSVPLAHALGSWPAALAVWAVPAALAAALWTVPAARARVRPVEEHPLRPWRLPIGWWLGLFFGIQSAAFYATLAWLPSMLQARGFGEREAGLLLALCSGVSFVPAFVLPVLAARGRDQRGLLAAAVAVPVAGWAGMAAAPGAAVAWVALIGAGQGAALGLALILPGLRAGDPRLVGPLMGMAQCIGYTMAACGPWLLGGRAGPHRGLDGAALRAAGHHRAGAAGGARRRPRQAPRAPAGVGTHGVVTSTPRPTP